MIVSVRKAIANIKKKYPELTVVSGADYDANYYLFETTEKPGEVDYNAPFYAVNKKTGEVCSFCPTAEMPKFINAFKSNRLDISKM